MCLPNLFLVKEKRDASNSLDMAINDVENLILRTRNETSHSFMDTENGYQEHRPNRACNFVVQATLRDKALELHARQYIAPSTDAFVKRHEALVAVYSQVETRSRYWNASHKNGRVFATRWRYFWGGRVGTLRAREHLEVDSMRRGFCAA